jgi:hypothetical protein
MCGERLASRVPQSNFANTSIGGWSTNSGECMRRRWLGARRSPAAEGLAHAAAVLAAT